MRMTLAQLKRDANSGTLLLEMVERYGDTGEAIPKKLRGKRKVLQTNSVTLILLNADGEESTLYIDSAKLIDYTDDALVVYNPGLREPTDEEKKDLDEINSIYKKYADTYNGGYWQGKDFGMKSSCPWMLGYDKIRGKRYESHNEMVRDDAVRGEKCLKYKVYRD